MSEELIEIPVKLYRKDLNGKLHEYCYDCLSHSIRKSDILKTITKLTRHLKRENVSEPFTKLVESQKRLSEEPLWVIIDRGSYNNLIELLAKIVKAYDDNQCKHCPDTEELSSIIAKIRKLMKG